MSHGTTDKLINSLISSINEPGQYIQKAPPPLFVVSNIATPHSPKSGGPRGHTPPRSPSGDKYLGRTLSPKTSGSLFDYSAKPAGTLHDNSGIGQNSTTLTSSFEGESQHSTGRAGGNNSPYAPGSSSQNNQAPQDGAMPYNRNFAKTDVASLKTMINSQEKGDDMFYQRQKKGSSPGGSAAQEESKS